VRIAFATCADLPEGDADDALLVEALAARGADVAWRRWDDGRVEWSSYDAVLLRSTWDYQGRRDEFLAWGRQVPRLLNPYEVIEWNTDKRYLAELAAAGLSVIDTEFVAAGEEPPALPVSEEVVVKPSVSAGSRDTARFSLANPVERAAARGLIGSIQASGRTAMLQPFMRRVDDNGETALIYFGGEFSHSARKGPLLVPGAGPTEELFAAETIEPRQATDAERDLADRVVAWIGRRFGAACAYARVDVLLDDDGEPLVLEVELTEPSLFLLHSDGGAGRFADLLVEALASR
jgi:glutathione synthase/RimK-type ligase-like ATP-grasp enzyme